MRDEVVDGRHCLEARGGGLRSGSRRVSPTKESVLGSRCVPRIDRS